MATRCHFNNGKFTVEELSISPGIILFTNDVLSEFLSENYKSLDEWDQMDVVDAIQNSFDGTVKGIDFSDAEGDCLLSEGLLGVLRMRYPEIAQNEVFNFYIKLNNTIQDLETRLQGHPYSDIINEIQAHLEDENAEDYNIWQAIHSNYTENFFWIGNSATGKGGVREAFLHDLEKMQQLSIKKHTSSEIGEAVSSVKQSDVESALHSITSEKEQTIDTKEK